MVAVGYTWYMVWCCTYYVQVLSLVLCNMYVLYMEQYLIRSYSSPWYIDCATPPPVQRVTGPKSQNRATKAPPT